MDLTIVGGNRDESKTEADTMLNGLILTTIPEPVLQVVDRFSRILILVNQPIGKVGTGSGVWRVGLIGNACTSKVRVQDGEGLLTVARVNQTK